MVNERITVVLGFAFAASLMFLLAAWDAQRDYKIANARINSVEAQMESFKNGENAFLKKYDINELKRGYSPPEISGGKTMVNVPIINQYPELPTGCEITSAAVLLNYIGYNADKVYLEENFLPKSAEFYVDASGNRFGPDPNSVFIGDPKGKGLGCYAPVIVNSLNAFFRSQGSACYAVNVANADQKTLEILLDNGIPIEVWASRGMQPFKYSDGNEWLLKSGEKFKWPSNSHALVLCGYDEIYYYFSDCDGKKDIQRYEKEVFLKRWDQFGRQGVIIKRK